MFQEAISRYLQSSGYSRIQLKSVLFDMDGVLFNSHALPCRCHSSYLVYQILLCFQADRCTEVINDSLLPVNCRNIPVYRVH